MEFTYPFNSPGTSEGRRPYEKKKMKENIIQVDLKII